MQKIFCSRKKMSSFLSSSFSSPLRCFCSEFALARQKSETRAGGSRSYTCVNWLMSMRATIGFWSS